MPNPSETKAAVLHIVDRLRIQKSVHDEKVLDNITIEVTKKCIYLGTNYKLKWNEIDVQTFDYQSDRLKQASLDSRARYFEYWLKTTDTCKPKFCLEVHGYQNLQKFNQFISQVSNRYNAWADKTTANVEESHIENSKRSVLNHSSTIRGISKITPLVNSKAPILPATKRQRNVYGSKSMTKIEKLQHKIFSRVNYNDDDDDATDDDEEMEDPDERLQSSKLPDSHMERSNNLSQTFNQLSDHNVKDADSNSRQGTVRLKTLKEARGRIDDDDDDEEDVDFDQTTNVTRLKNVLSVSDDEGDDAKALPMESHRTEEKSSSMSNKNQALVTPMTGTKSKLDALKKEASKMEETFNSLSDSNKKKTTINRFFSQKPIQNTKDETTKNKPHQYPSQRLSPYRPFPPPNEDEIHEEEHETMMSKRHQYPSQRLSSHRATSPPRSSPSYQASTKPPLERLSPVQTGSSTPKRPPPQFPTHSVQLTKRKFSSADTERNWTSARPLDLSSSLVDISSSPTKENHAVQQKFIGLRNLGNSCYLNAAVQMLFSVGSFISDLESFYTTIRMASSPGFLMPLTENLLDLARRMNILHSDHAIESSSADPSKLKKAVDNATDKFKGFQQRDAHEFAATFIDLLHEEAIAASQGGVVPTDTYFLMKVEVCLTCDSCGYSRLREEKYRHLSLDIGEVDQGSHHFSIKQGLQRFFSTEKIEVKCEQCQEGSLATQSMKIISRPKAIILHMKRFIVSYQERIAVAPSIRKNHATLFLNDELSLEDDTFSLRSVVHHLGTTAFSGHYLCDSVRVDIEERWVRFDDGLAKETSLSALIENEKNRGDAYMLMYTK